MNIRIMRTVDRFAGIPLCWLSGLLLKIFQHDHNSDKGPWRTILVMKFFGLGSLLLSTPFLSSLKHRAPGAKIVYLTFQANEELLAKLPQPDLRLVIRTSSLRTFIGDTLRVIRTLRSLSIDVVFDLEFFSKFSTLLSSMSGSRIRVGYALPTRWRRMNLTHPVALDQSAHATQLFLSQLRPFGTDQEPVAPVIRLESSAAATHSMAKKLGLHPNGVTTITININAGATSFERRWDPVRFVDVAYKLARVLPSARFFFTGTREESGYVDEALRHQPDLLPLSMNCAGLLSLDEFIALLEHTSLFLTSDSGPMHIAASVGTPLVALFGPESPQFYGPPGHPHVIYKGIACSPCLNIYDAKLFVCPYHARCMSEISVQEVFDAACRLLPALRAEPV